ncbi:MAG: protoheme farnesyltransferase [Candidatus Saccharibacteria bacterium]|nr:protoheme farnesyltransferase [Candidatus Saccharibacteria bacterium]
MATIKTYYSLTKPGVLYGNALTAAAGFLLASGGHVNLWLFLALCIGTTLIIASACVLNNYLDQDIDQKMERTKKRALVQKEIPGSHAVIFSIILGIVGLAILIAWTNMLVVWIGVGGFVVYVWLYGALSKRLSMHGTLVGSVSGAAPILAGYVAVTGTLDIGALLVFLILFFWQMPEFYSIAVYRQKEYKAAGVPVISVVKGIPQTKVQIFIYTLLFVVSTLLLTVFGITGITYFVAMTILGVYWLWLGFIGLRRESGDAWARKMFRFSLIILLAFCAIISIDAWLP